MEATMTCAALCNEIVRQVCEDPLLGDVAAGNRYIHFWRDLYATGLQPPPYQSGQQWYHALLWHLGEMLGIWLWHAWTLLQARTMPALCYRNELESNLTSSQLFFEFALTLPWFQLWSTFLSSSQSFSQLFSSFSSLPTSAQLSSTLLASSHRCSTFLISSRLFSTHLNSPKFFPTLPNSFHANLLFWTGPHLFSLFFNCGQHFSTLLRSSHLFPPLLLTSSPSNFIEVCSPHFFSTFLNFPHVLNSTSFWSQQFLATFSLFLSLCLTFTQKLVHTASICTLQHGEAFVQRSFCTEKLSHREAFSQIRFYIEMLSQREAFTHRSLYTEKLLHRRQASTQQKLLHSKTGSRRQSAFKRTIFRPLWRFKRSHKGK